MIGQWFDAVFGLRPRIDVATPSAVYTAPTEERLTEPSIKNWQRIPADKRRECIDVLKAYFLGSPAGGQMLLKFSKQKAEGVRLGNDDDWFHLGTGMQVRNVLRIALTDDQLPPVQYPNGPMQNWDDFYIGALHALVDDIEHNGLMQ